jgi:16S rRNA (cytidine1402-2'-O)-methyltransferase
VATPIGNLEDITFRAIRVLKDVTAIAAEDTRHTQKLLAAYDIHTPLTSYHDFNKEAKAHLLVSRLVAGETLALVCDAGTPTLSDPGYLLIRQAIEAGVPIHPIPGPAAAITALCVSGLPTDRFAFEGFLPRKSGGRRTRLLALTSDPRTLIFYESPHRVVALLSEMLLVMGNRQVALGREMTKHFEEIVRGSVTEVMEKIKGRTLRGEITLVVASASFSGMEAFSTENVQEPGQEPV